MQRIINEWFMYQYELGQLLSLFQLHAVASMIMKFEFLFHNKVNFGKSLSEQSKEEVMTVSNNMREKHGVMLACVCTYSVFEKGNWTLCIFNSTLR